MNLFEIVKASVSVPEAARAYGLDVTRHNMARCPFHDDRHQSLKLNPGFYYCFGCGARGDVIDLVAGLFDLSPYEAAGKIAADFGIDPDKPPEAAALAKPRHPIDAKLGTLQKELLKKANAKQGFDDLAEDIESLRSEKEALLLEDANRRGELDKLDELETFLDEHQEPVTDYDEGLVRRLIERITVSDDRLAFEFKCGLETEVQM